MSSNQPVIIEVAINGAVSKARNPNSPQGPEEIAEVASACLDAGAAIIHNHIEDITLPGQAAADRYLEGWRLIRKRHPQAILYPTVVFAESQEDRFSHVRALAVPGGADMVGYDPGSLNIGMGFDEDGLPPKDFVYRNGYEETRFVMELCDELGLPPSMSLFDPSFARAVLAWHRAGKLPRGSLVKFYFGGDWDMIAGGRGGASFGLFPTANGLDAYLEMFEGVDLPWAVAVPGGDLVGCGLARIAIERGGHLRVGLEDYGGTGTPSNVELVEAAVAACREAGRPVATAEQARVILGMESPALVS
jgi:3-keto-5-aminohexanoate cleavage enzyme